MKKSELRKMIKEEIQNLTEENYGWQIERGKEWDAYEEALETFGAEKFANEMAKAMGSNELGETLEFIFRQWDYDSPYLEK